MKSDNSIRNVTISAIQRKIKPPYPFSLTTLFQKESFHEIDDGITSLLTLEKEELPVALVLVDSKNFTIITTRQITTCFDGNVKTTSPQLIREWEWGDFKGYLKKPFTIGTLTLDSGHIFEIFIETGHASIVAICATTAITALRQNDTSLW